MCGQSVYICCMDTLQPQLLDYLDYRRYLSEFFDWKKKRSSYFSFRYLAAKTCVDSSNIAKVFVGKRHIPENSVSEWAKLYGLNATEEEYLTWAVRFSKARSDASAQVAFEKMMELQGPKPKILDAHQYKYFKQWYHSALFALLDVINFDGKNYRALAGALRPAITVVQAKESVALLEKLTLIFRDNTGTYQHGEKLVTTGEKWRSLAITQFQKQYIALAQKALSDIPKEERDISSLTLTASQKDIEIIKEMARNFRSEVIKLVQNSENEDTVFQLNLQIFPLSQTIKGE